MRKIRLLVIEDNRLLREGITAMINAQGDIRVVGASGGSDSALLKAHKLKPQVILLDLGLRNQNGLRVVGSVRKKFPEVKVIGMGLIPSQEDIIEFVEAGASGFILKDATVDDFLRAIRSVAKGIKVLPPPLTGSLFSHVVERALKKGEGKLTVAVRMTR
jgi:DNA-binding NarL/FixJ family response regulator